MARLCKQWASRLALAHNNERLTQHAPVVRLLLCLGAVFCCLPSSILARDWSNDRIVSEAVGIPMASLPDTAQDGLTLRSRVVLRYTRRPNLWAACFVPVGYLPLSFRVSVECRTVVLASSPSGSREFSATAQASRTVWGRAPNPERPTQDPDYEAMESESRRKAAQSVAGQVEVWLKHEEM